MHAELAPEPRLLEVSEQHNARSCSSSRTALPTRRRATRSARPPVWRPNRARQSVCMGRSRSRRRSRPSSNGITAATGPKTSSRATRSSLVASTERAGRGRESRGRRARLHGRRRSRRRTTLRAFPLLGGDERPSPSPPAWVADLTLRRPRRAAPGSGRRCAGRRCASARSSPGLRCRRRRCAAAAAFLEISVGKDHAGRLDFELERDADRLGGAL